MPVFKYEHGKCDFTTTLYERFAGFAISARRDDRIDATLLSYLKTSAVLFVCCTRLVQSYISAKVWPAIAASMRPIDPSSGVVCDNQGGKTRPMASMHSLFSFLDFAKGIWAIWSSSFPVSVTEGILTAGLQQMHEGQQTRACNNYNDVYSAATYDVLYWAMQSEYTSGITERWRWHETTSDRHRLVIDCYILRGQRGLLRRHSTNNSQVFGDCRDSNLCDADRK